MNFKQEGTKTEQVLRSLEAMISFGKFHADAVIVDGYDFTKSAVGGPGQVQGLRPEAGPGSLVQRLAQGKRRRPSTAKQGMPDLLKGAADGIDVLITLHAEADHVELRVVKDRDHPAPGVLKLKLDPKTLLIM